MKMPCPTLLTSTEANGGNKVSRVRSCAASLRFAHSLPPPLSSLTDMSGSSGHSPFARANLPPSVGYSSGFPSTSLSSPFRSSPYVTDNMGSSGGQWRDSYSASSGGKAQTAASSTAAASTQAELRGQTLEEMYSAPENTLEIEVRDPRTQGEHTAPSAEALDCGRGRLLGAQLACRVSRAADCWGCARLTFNVSNSAMSTDRVPLVPRCPTHLNPPE